MPVRKSIFFSVALQKLSLRLGSWTAGAYEPYLLTLILKRSGFIKMLMLSFLNKVLDPHVHLQGGVAKC